MKRSLQARMAWFAGVSMLGRFAAATPPPDPLPGGWYEYYQQRPGIMNAVGYRISTWMASEPTPACLVSGSDEDVVARWDIRGPRTGKGEAIQNAEYRHETHYVTLREVGPGTSPGPEPDPTKLWIKKITIDGIERIKGDNVPVTVNGIVYDISWTADGMNARIRQQDYERWHPKLIPTIQAVVRVTAQAKPGHWWIACRSGIKLLDNEKEPFDPLAPGTGEGEPWNQLPSDPIQLRDASAGNTIYICWSAFRASFDKPGLEIIRVPDFVYAQATGAVPVRFRVIGGGTYRLRCPGTGDPTTVRARFWLNGVSNDWEVKFARQPGTGGCQNGMDNEYVAWIPEDKFNSLGLGGAPILRQNIGFWIQADAAPSDPASGNAVGPYQTLESSLYDIHCKVSTFGNMDVRVIELRAGKKEWPLTGVSLACNKDAPQRYRCVMGRVYAHRPHPVPNQPLTPHVANAHGENDPNKCNVFQMLMTADLCRCNRNETDKQIELDTALGRKGVLDYSEEEFESSRLNETKGFYIGASYGLVDVIVLGGAKGLNPDKDNGTGKFLVADDDVKVHGTIQDLNDPVSKEIIDWSKLAPSAGQILWSLGKALVTHNPFDWVALLSSGAAAIDSINWKLLTAPPPDAASIRFRVYGNRISVNGDEESTPIMRYNWPPMLKNLDESGPGPIPLSEDEWNITVGQTYFRWFHMDASCSSSAAISEKIQAKIRVFTEGTKAFNAPNCMSFWAD